MKLIALGPNGTYSHLAALKVSPISEIDFVNSIPDGFELLRGKKHDAFVTPVENLIYGTIRETIDGLYENNFKIAGAISLPVHHALLSGSKSIKKIFSHNQALNQCRKFLQKNYKNAELISCNSTAIACQKADGEKNSAAIAPETIVAWHPKLNIIAKNIEDDRKNRTTFLIISDSFSLLNEKTTSIIIEPNADESGILLAILKIFKSAKINLSKIESRPNRKNLGFYLFFIDFEGDFRQPKIARLLKKLENSRAVKKLKILGSFTT